MTEQLIPLELIDDNPYQHRESYKDIDSLGRTIAVNGLEQKPKARPVPLGGRYQLKEGHRRKRAFLWARDNWQAEHLPDRYDGYTVMPLDVEAATDQQMFDGMVIENIHRDDLKPTEIAHLLKDYQTQFPNATSKDIGLIFNMNDATVRGMIRLPDLPKEWQMSLDDGQISQGVARLGLSVQKIASTAEMSKIIKKVEKAKGKELPEAVIEDAVKYLPKVVRMWDGEGKPRSGYRAGWLLEMKNFPNKYLPEVDPGDVEDALQLDVDNPITDKFFALFEKYHDEHPDETTYRNISFDGLDVPAATIERVRVLVNPPACTACPFYTKIRGSHFCGMKACHTRKTQAWKTSLLEQASKNLKIALYDKSDGRYLMLESYEEKHKKLFEKRDPSLRLLPKDMAGDRYHYQSYAYKGVDDDVFFVVATGASLEKVATNGGKSGGGKKTEKEKAEMRAMKIYRARRKGLLWEYTAVAQGMLEAVPASTLEVLNRWHYIGIDDRIPAEHEPAKDAKPAEKLEFARRSLVWRLVAEECSHYRREPLVDILEKFQEITGVRTPKTLIKQITEWDAEIDAVAKAVSTETTKKASKK